jgi:hypothetical protein
MVCAWVLTGVKQNLRSEQSKSVDDTATDEEPGLAKKHPTNSESRGLRPAEGGAAFGQE